MVGWVNPPVNKFIVAPYGAGTQHQGKDRAVYIGLPLSKELPHQQIPLFHMSKLTGLISSKCKIRASSQEIVFWTCRKDKGCWQWAMPSCHFFPHTLWAWTVVGIDFSRWRAWEAQPLPTRTLQCPGLSSQPEQSRFTLSQLATKQHFFHKSASLQCTKHLLPTFLSGIFSKAIASPISFLQEV